MTDGFLLPADLFVVGCDLGDVRDFTAVVVNHVRQVPTGATRSTVSGPPGARWVEAIPITAPRHEISFLARWRGRGYRDIGTYLAELTARIDRTHRQAQLDAGHHQSRAPRVAVVLDGTGVGHAIVEQVRAAVLDAVAVTITAGGVAHGTGRDWWVSKQDLIGVLQVLLQNRELTIADVPLRDVLLEELQAFRARISVTGHTSYEASTAAEDWRGEGGHDDTVLAVALAAWYADRVDRERQQGHEAVEVFQNAYAAAYRSG